MMEEERTSALGIGESMPGVEAVVVETAPAVSVNGILEAASLDQVLAEERASAEQANNRPVIQGLAGYIKNCWQEAKDGKLDIEQRMLQSLRQRNGEYDPDMLAQLRAQGSAIVYMMLTSNKCRAASAWLREALQGLPWKAVPTPVPDIDDTSKAGIVQGTKWLIQQSLMMGYQPSNDEVRGFMSAMRDQLYAKIQEEAKKRAERMTEKMKDQLVEGGFEDAMDAFIDDLVTYPAAIIKGPVISQRPMLKYMPPDQEGKVNIDVQQVYKLEWRRVSPFDIYPAADASSVDDGYLIERHKLSRQDLVDLRDVEGYSREAIDAALDDYGRIGLQEMLSVDSDRLSPENKGFRANENPSRTIEALQFWGSVQGKLLLEWGLKEDEIEDPLAEYHIEAWLVGNWVIRAVVNPDPLHRKPYYKTSWENIPGAFWGRSIPDLCADSQRVCNATARALVNNVSIASGPQVVYDVSRLPKGESLSSMYPWKIWQYKDSGLSGSSSQPISFFQPDSNAQQLMAIYEKFSVLADEYTGIPRYMTGDSHVSGAGSTASGMSMLMSNAGKSIKNVVASVDRILKPAIERLYMYNMMYLDDPELKGDVNIQVEGAETLVRQQQQQQRLNEFLGLATSNPVINQLIGVEGIAYMLREVAENLGLDTDRIIPALPVLKARMQIQQTQMAMAQAKLAEQQAQAQGQPQAGGTPQKPQNAFDQRRLMNGAPQVNTKAAMQ